jgi:hypothetical protein
VKNQRYQRKQHSQNDQLERDIAPFDSNELRQKDHEEQQGFRVQEAIDHAPSEIDPSEPSVFPEARGPAGVFKACHAS